MNNIEFEQAIKGTVERRGIQVREVSNGYSMVMTRTFEDKDTRTSKFSVNIEGVAANKGQLMTAVQNFFNSGDPAKADTPASDLV